MSLESQSSWGNSDILTKHSMKRTTTEEMQFPVGAVRYKLLGRGIEEWEETSEYKVHLVKEKTHNSPSVLTLQDYGDKDKVIDELLIKKPTVVEEESEDSVSIEQGEVNLRLEMREEGGKLVKFVIESEEIIFLPQ